MKTSPKTGTALWTLVHNYRELYGADIVSLFVENRVTSVSGIAYQLENLSAGNVDRMFSVINRNLSLAGLVFAHEVGHNFGAGHEGEEGFLADSSAHSFSTYKTVMSVAQSGTRVNYFSNPAVSFDGVPTGISVCLIISELLTQQRIQFLDFTDGCC